MLPENPTLQDVLNEIGRLNEEYFDEQDYKSIPFMILALTGEVGEMANAYKKILRGQQVAEFTDNIEKELADMLVYSMMICRALNMDVVAMIRNRLAVIEERAEDGYYSA